MVGVDPTLALLLWLLLLLGHVIHLLMLMQLLGHSLQLIHQSSLLLAHTFLPDPRYCGTNHSTFA